MPTKGPPKTKKPKPVNDLLFELMYEYAFFDIPDIYQTILGRLDEPIAWMLCKNGLNNVRNPRILYCEKPENRYILDIDITAAYPSICRYWFGYDSDFYRYIDGLQSKLMKVIAVSDELTKHSMGDFLEYFKRVCKMMITMFVFDGEDSSDIQLLEYMTDGMCVICGQSTKNRLDDIIHNDRRATQFLLERGFDIHYTEYEKYVGYLANFYYRPDKEKLKDKFHYPPPKTHDLMHSLITINDVTSSESQQIIDELYRVYNSWEAVKQSTSILDDYYVCTNRDGEKVIIDERGENVKFIEDRGALQVRTDAVASPAMYRNIFINPIITAIRNNWEGGL